MARSREEIISEMIDAGFSDDEIRNAFKTSVKSNAKPIGLIELAKRTDPTQLIKQAAPSNVLRMLSTASATAPGATSAFINSLPGIGNPSHLISSLENIKKDPSQVQKAAKRLIAIEAGSPLNEKEKLLSTIGRAAGTGLELLTPTASLAGVKATGPFTAGLKSPSSAIPGKFEEVAKSYSEAKQLTRLGESASEANRLRKMLGSDAGTRKLADEAIVALQRTQEAEPTHLLAYREALGKMQAKGGTFADDYAKFKDIASDLLKKKSPQLMSEMEKMATQYAAKGEDLSLPWLTFAINPKVGALKAFNLPYAKNVAGAITSKVAEVVPPVSAATPSAVKVAKMFKNLDRDKAKEYLLEAFKETKDEKKARQLARERAKKDGYEVVSK